MKVKRKIKYKYPVFWTLFQYCVDLWVQKRCLRHHDLTVLAVPVNALQEFTLPKPRPKEGKRFPKNKPARHFKRLKALE